MVRPFRVIKDVVAAFLARGCELRHTSHVTYLDGTTGEPVDPIPFLFNPATKGFMPLDDFEDDERIPPSEVETWERRLGISLTTN
jgi:hypothetical protein